MCSWVASGIQSGLLMCVRRVVVVVVVVDAGTVCVCVNASAVENYQAPNGSAMP